MAASSPSPAMRAGLSYIDSSRHADLPEHLKRHTSTRILTPQSDQSHRGVRTHQRAESYAPKSNSYNIPRLDPSPTFSTAYDPQASPLEDYPDSQSATSYRPKLQDAFLDKCKLAASTVSSRATSPVRPASRLFTPQTAHSTSSSTAYHGASEASTRAPPSRPRHSYSRSLFENFLQPYASPGPDEYPNPEDFESGSDMESTYTRSARESPRAAQGHRRERSGGAFANTMGLGEKLSWLKKRVATNASTSTTSSRSSAGYDDSLMNDPLLTLDISHALFPSGAPSLSHASSNADSAAFHELLHHATALAQTMQQAYKQRALALSDARAELAARADELDEAGTRNRHLRTQLDDVTERVSATEQRLRAQLVDERDARAMADERVLELQCQVAELKAEKAMQMQNTRKIAVMRPSQAWRSHASKPSVASDSGFESEHEHELELDGASVASSCPASPYSSSRSSTGHDDVFSPTSPSSSPRIDGALADKTPVLRSSAAANPVYGAGWDFDRPQVPVPIQGGMDLWSENVALRERVVELEGAVDACLAML